LPPGLHRIVADGLAAGWLSFTVAETLIASPFRDWADLAGPVMSHFVRCGHCMGIWFSLLIVAFTGGAGFGFIVDLLATSSIASLFWAGMVVLMDLGGK
jgi:hypothetical protein